MSCTDLHSHSFGFEMRAEMAKRRGGTCGWQLLLTKGRSFRTMTRRRQLALGQVRPSTRSSAFAAQLPSGRITTQAKSTRLTAAWHSRRAVGMRANENAVIDTRSPVYHLVIHLGLPVLPRGNLGDDPTIWRSSLSSSPPLTTTSPIWLVSIGRDRVNELSWLDRLRMYSGEGLRESDVAARMTARGALDAWRVVQQPKVPCGEEKFVACISRQFTQGFGFFAERWRRLSWQGRPPSSRPEVSSSEDSELAADGTKLMDKRAWLSERIVPPRNASIGRIRFLADFPLWSFIRF